MGDLAKQAEPAIEKLLLSKPDQLYEQLGLRRQAIEDDALHAGDFDTRATYDAAFAGPLDVLRDLGNSFFKHVNKDVYELVCGSDKGHTAERGKILKAIGGGPTAFAAALAGAIVTTLGLAPAIAAVVAALVVKLFFKNAHRATCEVWSKHLPKAPSKRTITKNNKLHKSGSAKKKKRTR